ncbi:MAG: hypothetical protein DI582_11080, partial [Azospirillum brasilense]
MLGCIHDDHLLRFSLSKRSSMVGAKLIRWPWSKLIERFAQPFVDNISEKEYRALDKIDQTKRKAIKGWIAGCPFINNYRIRRNAGNFSLILLDFDDLTPELATYLFYEDGSAPAHQYEWVAYTTRSHSPEHPRWRVIIPLEKPILPKLYPAVASIFAAQFANTASVKLAAIMDAVDPASFVVGQMMFRPTVSKGQEFKSLHNPGKLLNAAKLLEAFNGDYEDFSKLPRSQKRIAQYISSQSTAVDPTKKEGFIGIFCRIYTVHDVIEQWLQDTWSAEGEYGGQTSYLYAGSSHAPGGLVHDGGKYFYSHHANRDPYSFRLLNPFDLMRLHRFGELDEGLPPNTKLKDLPSFQALRRAVMADKNFAAAYAREAKARETEGLEMVEVIEPILYEPDILDFIGGAALSVRTRTKMIPKFVKELNSQYAVVTLPNGLRIMFFKHDGTFSLLGMPDFSLANGKKKIHYDGSNRDITEAWIMNDDRRKYPQGIVFRPDGDVAGAYNLFQGWPLRSAEGDCPLILRHIREVICNNDPIIFKALMQYLAHMIQRPAEKPRYCLIIGGKKGTGKDTLAA